VVALAVHSVVGIGAAVIDLQRAALIDRLVTDPAAVEDAEIAASDTVYAVSGLVEFGVAILTAVVFLIWLFRVRANAEILAPDEQRRARPWLIFGWIVPIISLWFPKQIVDDIWSATHRDETHPRPRSGLVTGWWVAWLLGSWVSNAAARLFFNAEELPEMANAARFDVASIVMLLVAAVPAAMVVLRISNAQEARRLTSPPQFMAGPGY